MNNGARTEELSTTRQRVHASHADTVERSTTRLRSVGGPGHVSGGAGPASPGALSDGRATSRRNTSEFADLHLTSGHCANLGAELKGCSPKQKLRLPLAPIGEERGSARDLHVRAPPPARLAATEIELWQKPNHS